MNTFGTPHTRPLPWWIRHGLRFGLGLNVAVIVSVLVPLVSLAWAVLPDLWATALSATLVVPLWIMGAELQAPPELKRPAARWPAWQVLRLSTWSLLLTTLINSTHMVLAHPGVWTWVTVAGVDLLMLVVTHSVLNLSRRLQSDLTARPPDSTAT